MHLFLSAISSGKLKSLNNHPSVGCAHLVLISQLCQLKQCRLGVLLKDTNILMQLGFEPLITVSRNQHLTHMTNMTIGLVLSIGVHSHIDSININSSTFFEKTVINCKKEI